MRGFNKVVILGRIGHQPELKETTTGQQYLDLSIATNRPVRKDDEWSEIADWHSVRLWARDAERCADRLKKGSPIAVEGTLRTSSWVGEDQQKRSKTWVRADRAYFLPA